ncbi:MAG: hypothetical protein WDN04_09860 [Rhodospirillales bacterium]
MTSTSTVGLPRLSRISRAAMSVMAHMFGHQSSVVGRQMPRGSDPGNRALETGERQVVTAAARSPTSAAMLLLTWHGTILRVEQAENRLTHAPPVPVRPAARDFTFAAPDEGLALPHSLDGETVIIEAAHPGACIWCGAGGICAPTRPARSRISTPTPAPSGNHSCR